MGFSVVHYHSLAKWNHWQGRLLYAQPNQPVENDPNPLGRRQCGTGRECCWSSEWYGPGKFRSMVGCSGAKGPLPGWEVSGDPSLSGSAWIWYEAHPNIPSFQTQYQCEAGTTEFNTSVDTFCSRVCRECVCKNTALSNTCYDTCKLFWFQTPLACSAGISFNFLGTFPIEWTKDSGCVKNQVQNAQDWSPQQTCQWVCGCCKSHDHNCVNDCQNAFFPWFYDHVCHAIGDPGFVFPQLSWALR